MISASVLVGSRIQLSRVGLSGSGIATDRDACQRAADVRGIRLDVPVTVYDVARQLPTIANLRDLCRSLAMLDAILSPDWESRYY
ncbi:hypothetical protein [Streptomyces sp. NBC_00316]|uniref:hypothetical protein n=1 Tax=Streptomyces sp. NBC_00316 TaxID=2975710 RepID=UPI002E297F68|nr:hypothetical protein [Streptomyces sp. NBC_00316]